MGVIQNSVNSAIGTAAAATAMGKHTLEQQKSNDLAKLSATKTAINDYVDNNLEAKKLQTEEDAETLRLQDLKDLNRPESMIQEQQKKLDNIYAKGNQLRLKMQSEDEQWKLLGINKEDLKSLNTEADKEIVHRFKQKDPMQRALVRQETLQMKQNAQNQLKYRRGADLDE